MTITSTHWLLLGIIIFCAACVAIIAIGHAINTEWNQADEPAYRTADGKAIARQTAAIIKAAVKHGESSAAAKLQPNLDTIRREATAAAIHDMGRKPGTPSTFNPHQEGSLAFYVWAKSYNAVTRGQSEGQHHG